MAGNKLLLQARDLRLLTEVASMRLTDRELAQIAGGFTNCTRRVNDRLLKLVRAGLLNRFFIGTIGAGRKAIYALSRKGAALIESPQRLVSRRFGQTLVGDFFVDHQLEINRVYVGLKFRELPEGIHLHVWRTFSGALTTQIPLIPDAYFETETPTGIKGQFLEVDMGTETRAVWDRKVRHYLELARSGQFQQLFSQPQFRVLVLAASDRRLANIRNVVLKQTDKIFFFATFDDINRSGIWVPVWLRPTGDHKVPLL